MHITEPKYVSLYFCLFVYHQLPSPYFFNFTFSLQSFSPPRSSLCVSPDDDGVLSHTSAAAGDLVVLLPRKSNRIVTLSLNRRRAAAPKNGKKKNVDENQEDEGEVVPDVRSVPWFDSPELRPRCAALSPGEDFLAVVAARGDVFVAPTQLLSPGFRARGDSYSYLRIRVVYFNFRFLFPRQRLQLPLVVGPLPDGASLQGCPEQDRGHERSRRSKPPPPAATTTTATFVHDHAVFVFRLLQVRSPRPRRRRTHGSAVVDIAGLCLRLLRWHLLWRHRLCRSGHWGRGQ